MTKLIALAFWTTVSLVAQSPETRLLWPGGAPGAQDDGDAGKPSLTIYLPRPEAATGAGVVICPGGAYGHLSMDKEGAQIAEWLNARGVAGFVLKYRLGPRYHHPIELGDAQRALRLVRAHAAEFRVSGDRIGVWGFSAGGHLASTLATHFDAGEATAPDPIDRLSCRPDFVILAYPVVTLLDPYTHKGSRTNLLGENPDPALVASLSNETQVTARTPPTFLFHTDADRTVPAENSVQFYLALRKAGVPAELHIYQPGGHGVGLAQKDPILSTWPDRLAVWLKAQGAIR